MKRKFKMITSVASLCVAITLLMFGVYAAATPNVTVTGTVSFSATNVLATITGVKGVDASDANWADSLTTVTYGVGTTDAQTIAVGTINLTDAAVKGGYKISIRSDFEATSSSKIKITSTLPTTITETGYTVTFAGDANWTTATTTGITGGQTATVIVTVTVNPALANATFTEDIGMNITLARA